jgi:hypothetical protein
MPVLRNARYEAFCQALAAGKSAGKAYVFSGFAASYANASRLQRTDIIRRRVNEILDQKQRAADRAVASAAARVGIDQEWVLRNLKLNALMSMRAGDRSAAARSLELLGKHVGLFIEKKELQISCVDDADAYLAKLLELVGQPVLEHEPLQQRRLEHAEKDGLLDGSKPEPEADTIDIIEEIV